MSYPAISRPANRAAGNLKPRAHRAGLPGKEISFILCPLTPPIPLWRDGVRSGQGGVKMEFWEIYDLYYSKVRKFILALVKDEWVADDIIQETFLKVQQNIESLRDPSRLSSWIFRIAHNLCQDHFRRLKKSRKEEKIDQEETEDLNEALIQKELGIQKELEQRQMGECVQNQINLLTEPLRTVLVLFDIMEFSHQESADILGITVKNAKVRLHRARKKLKTILEEKCAFERDERNVLICTPARNTETSLSERQDPSVRGTSLRKPELRGRRPSKP
jgi:RNA polymerase sigma-70 factor, ECF subfamily